MEKRCKQRGRFAVCALLLLSMAAAWQPPAAAAEAESVFAQIDSVQTLAEAYADTQEGAPDTLMMTINYIRQQQYAGDTWNLVLGTPDDGFSQYVAAQNSALSNLQYTQFLALPGGGTADFVHLIVGIGGAYQSMPVVCTWGGDCIQLAQQCRGGGSVGDCMQRMSPYFAAEDTNASLFPQNDLLADLDGVNIGSQLSKGDSLAQAMRDYYAGLTGEQRASQFVAIQFGGANTGDTEGFRELVRTTFQEDDAVQLFLLSQGEMSYSSQTGSSLADDLAAPLDAACNLMADYLSGALGGQTVAGAATAAPTPQEQIEESTAAPIAQNTPVPQEGLQGWAQQAKATPWVESLLAHPLFVFGGLALLICLLLWLIFRR